MKVYGTLETQNWQRLVQRLEKYAKENIEEVMEQSARLIIRDTVGFTPPFGNAPVTETFGPSLSYYTNRTV